MGNSHNSGAPPSAVDKISLFVPGVAAILGYQRANIRYDLIAGLSVAAIALPVGIAYAEIAGVPVVYGIYSALIPLFIYALFGSSRQLITGPDAATCLMVASAVAPLAGGDPQRYLELVVTITLVTGLFHVIFGFCRFGFIANFLSQPILIGYLNGVALIILIGQFPKIFGYESDGGEFFTKIIELFSKIDTFHLQTALLGIAAIIALLLMKRFSPRLPAPLIVTASAIAVVWLLDLQNSGVAVLGKVPEGFPMLHIPTFDHSTFRPLLKQGAGIALISFTSGILTAKSFASRNRYDINADQELVAFGACNIASGLVQGFPVTGADSRTAVNNSMHGKTQLVGIVAGIAILLFLLFLTGPLSFLPNTALAAIVAVSSLGLLDLAAVRELARASRRELVLCLITTAGVLYLDVLPAVFLAIILTLLWILLVASQPYVEELGRVPGVSGYHDVSKHPEAATIPGLLLCRFNGNLVFFNIDYFKKQLTSAIAAADTPVEWVVVDASSVNYIDITALHKLIDLNDELRGQGIHLTYARVKSSLWRYFDRSWLEEKPRFAERVNYYTLTSAVNAFKQYKAEHEPT